MLNRLHNPTHSDKQKNAPLPPQSEERIRRTVKDVLDEISPILTEFKNAINKYPGILQLNYNNGEYIFICDLDQIEHLLQSEGLST